MSSSASATGCAVDLDLVGEIRAARPEARVIIISDCEEPELVLRAMREHTFAFFRRPFDPEALKDAVAQALGAPDWEDGIELLSGRPEWISLRLRCRRFTATRILQFFSELRVDLPDRERDSIATAFREILLNAIEHGGQLDPEKRVDVSRIRSERFVLYRVSDPGSGLTREALGHAASADPTGDPIAHELARAERGLRPGGFGMLIASSLADELLYNEKGNEAILIKYLPPGDTGG
jgi:anti-sigma regulatory factor (Ser/Thr protein kinase)